MAVSLWLRVPSLPGDGISRAVTIAPGRQLSFTLWTHDLAFSPLYTTGGLTRQKPGPLRLTIRHQRFPPGTREQLAVLTISPWPLVIGALLLMMAAAWLWRGWPATAR